MSKQGLYAKINYLDDFGQIYYIDCDNNGMCVKEGNGEDVYLCTNKSKSGSFYDSEECKEFRNNQADKNFGYHYDGCYSSQSKCLGEVEPPTNIPCSTTEMAKCERIDNPDKSTFQKNCIPATQTDTSAITDPNRCFVTMEDPCDLLIPGAGSDYSPRSCRDSCCKTHM